MIIDVPYYGTDVIRVEAAAEPSTVAGLTDVAVDITLVVWLVEVACICAARLTGQPRDCATARCTPCIGVLASELGQLTKLAQLRVEGLTIAQLHAVCEHLQWHMQDTATAGCIDENCPQLPIIACVT
jgi:hypothetical protein